MEVAILYDGFAEANLAKEAELLWVSALFSETVFYTGGLAEAILISLNFNKYTDSQKAEVVISVMRLDENTEEEIEEFREINLQYQLFKKQRKPSKKMLVTFMKAKKAMEEMYEIYRKAFDEDLESLDAIELKPLCTVQNPSRLKPLWVASLSKNNIYSEQESAINFLKPRLAGFTSLPILHSFNQLGCSMLNFSPSIDNQEDVDVITDVLFEIPIPYSLTTAQIILLRNDLSTASWKLMKELERIKEKFANILFSVQNYALLNELYGNKITELKKKLAEEIESNNLFQELNGPDNSADTITLYLGCTSFSNLISMYRVANLINDTIELYTKEELSATTNLLNSTIFLFIE